MTPLGVAAVLALGSMAAGFFGALTGLGGGAVIVPLLVLGLGVEIRYAIGASLVAVIATSSGAAAAFVRDGFTNIRLAMFLEVATTIGAISGAALAPRVPAAGLAIAFGVVLLYSAYLSWFHPVIAEEPRPPDWLAVRLRLDASYPSASGPLDYRVQRVPAGFLLMYVAGLISGLLGVGSGATKVLAMDRAMRLPFKVSTTTSNFIIGVTAAASAGIYLGRGYIDPGLAMPVVLGTLAGSLLGARMLRRARTPWLRAVFAVVVVLLALEMVYNGLVSWTLN